MTFRPKDFKDVADLVARKLEVYMNLERRELRFNPQGYFRTTSKMEDYDLLFRVDDNLAKTDKTRRLLGPPGEGKHPQRNRSPKSPKAKRSKSSAGQTTKTGIERKKSKVTTKGSSKSVKKKTVEEDRESERGEIEEKSLSEDGDPVVDRKTKDQKTDDPEVDKEEKYLVDDNPEKKGNTVQIDDDPELDKKAKDQVDDNSGQDEAGKGQIDDNSEGNKEAQNQVDDDSKQDKEAKDHHDDNSGQDKEAKDHGDDDNSVEDKKEKDDSTKSISRGKDLHKENKKHKKQRRKENQEKTYISPKLIETTRQVMPVREYGRLTSFANSIFSEQPVEKLQIIHRYRPNSDDIPHITENGKVQNYTCHVGSALHSTKYIDYYIKEGLQTGNKEHSKRLQKLKSAKITEKSGETPAKNQAVISDGKQQKNGSQSRKTALITADPLALVRPSSSASSGSTRSTSYGYSSSSYNSDFTTSYHVCRDSSSSAFSSSASACASESSLITPPSETVSLPNIKTAWVMTPRSSRDFVPTPYSSRDDIQAGQNKFHNRQLSDEDSISLSSFDIASRDLGSKSNYSDNNMNSLMPCDKVQNSHHDKIAVEDTSMESFKKNSAPTTLEMKQNPIVSEKEVDAHFETTSLVFEKNVSSGCRYDEFYDGSVDSMHPFEYRGDDENMRTEDPDYCRGNWFEGNQHLKEECRGSAVEESFNTNFSLVSPTGKSNYSRTSAYVHVAEERGNEHEVLVSSEEEHPFYVTADHPSVERLKTPEDNFDKTGSSSRGILPKLKLSEPCWNNDRSSIDTTDHIGEDITDIGNHLQLKRNEESLPHGRGTRKSEHHLEVERSQSRSSQASVEKDITLDKYIKDDDHLRLISSRASVEKYIPDDLPYEAQYTPTNTNSAYDEIKKNELIDQELSRGPEFNSEKENRFDSGSSRASTSHGSEKKSEPPRNDVSLLDLFDNGTEMGKNTSESTGSRGTLPANLPNQNGNSSENSRSSLKSENLSCKGSDYVSMVILKTTSSNSISSRPTEHRMQMHNDPEIQSYPVVENYVPSPRSKQKIPCDEPKPAAGVEQNANKKLTEKTSDKDQKKQTGHKLVSTDPVKTIISSVSITGQTIYVDNNSESYTEELKDTTMNSAIDGVYLDSKDVPDNDYSNKQEGDISSTNVVSIKSLDIKPGTISPPSSKILKRNEVETKSENRPPSSVSITSSRGTDSEKIDRSDSSLISENKNNSLLYSVSKTTSRGSDSPQSSKTSSCSSVVSLKKKLVPLDSSLLSSSGRALTRGVDSRRRRTRKSISSKLSTQSSTEEDTSSQTSSKQVSVKRKTSKRVQSRSSTAEESKSLSLLSSSASIIERQGNKSAEMQSNIASDHTIQQTHTSFPVDVHTSHSGRASQKQYSISSSTVDSIVIDNPVFSPTSSETSAKDETEQGTSFRTTHSWSTSSKDAKESSTAVSTSFSPSPNLSVSDHTSTSHTTISRGNDNETEGLIIDINCDPPLTKFLDIQSTKSATDVQIMLDLESNESCKTMKSTSSTSTDNIDMNVYGRSILAEIDVTTLEEKADFVLCPSIKSHKRSMSAAEQAQVINFPVVSCHADLPVLESSRGSETGDSSDNKSQFSDLTLKFQSLQQEKSETTSSKELSPRIDSRSSSDLSQASLTKVNFQQKEKEEIVAHNIVVGHDNEATHVIASSHTTTEYISQKIDTGYPLSVNGSSIFEKSEYVLPDGMVFDLKEHDSERGDIVNYEDSNKIKMGFTEKENNTTEYRTTIPKLNGIQKTSSVDSENGQSQPEFRGELSDFGVVDSEDDQTSLKMASEEGIINCQENHTFQTCHTEEQLTYIMKGDESEQAADSADITSQTKHIEHVLKESDQVALEDNACVLKAIVDDNKESNFKEDDDFMLALSKRIKQNIPAISVSEVTAVQESLFKEETNDSSVVNIRNDLQETMSREDGAEAYICVESIESVQDQDKVCTPFQSINSFINAERGSNDDTQESSPSLGETVGKVENFNVNVLSTPESKVTQQEIFDLSQEVEHEQEIFETPLITAVNSQWMEPNVEAVSILSPLHAEQTTSSLQSKDNSSQNAVLIPNMENTQGDITLTPPVYESSLPQKEEQDSFPWPQVADVLQIGKKIQDISPSLEITKIQPDITSPPQVEPVQQDSFAPNMENTQDDITLTPPVYESSLPQKKEQDSLPWPQIADVLQIGKDFQEISPSLEMTKIQPDITSPPQVETVQQDSFAPNMENTQDDITLTPPVYESSLPQKKEQDSLPWPQIADVLQIGKDFQEISPSLEMTKIQPDITSPPQVETVQQDSLASPKVKELLQMKKDQQEILLSLEITKMESNVTPSQELEISKTYPYITHSPHVEIKTSDTKPSSQLEMSKTRPDITHSPQMIKSPLVENTQDHMKQDFIPSIQMELYQTETESEVLDTTDTHLPPETTQINVLPISQTEEVLETVDTMLPPQTTQTDVLTFSQTETEVLETTDTRLPPETTQTDVLPISQTETDVLETTDTRLPPQTTQTDVLPFSQTETDVLETVDTQLPPQITQTDVLAISQTETEVLETVDTQLPPEITQTDVLPISQTEGCKTVVTQLSPETTQINVLSISQTETEVFDAVDTWLLPETTQIDVLPISQTEGCKTVDIQLPPETTQINVLSISQTETEVLETVVTQLPPETTQIDVLPISQTKTEVLETVVNQLPPETSQTDVLPISQTKTEVLETVVNQLPPETTQTDVLPISQTKTEVLETVVNQLPPETTQTDVLPISQTKTEVLETVVNQLPPETSQIDVLPISQTKTEVLEIVDTKIPPETTRIDVLPISQTETEVLETVDTWLPPETTQIDVLSFS